MPDGYITYSTKLDNSALEKDLAKATKSVEKLESQAQKNAAKRLPIAEQVADLGAKLDAAKAKMAALQSESEKVAAAISGANANDPASVAAYAEASARRPALEKELAAAHKAADRLQEKFNRADAKLKEVDTNARRLEADLNAAKEKAGGIVDELSKPVTASERMGEAVAHAENQMGKFTHRVGQLAKRVFVFTLITQALRAIREHMGKYVTANSEAAQAISQLKGALLTLAQPVLSVVIPALTLLVNILTRVVSAVANLLSLLFGKGIKQTKQAAKVMYSEAEAIEAAGAAAEKASGSLAAFDEINQLSNNSGGGAAAATMAPDFDFDTSTVEADMEKLLGWIKLIGAGLLAWRLSDSFLGGMKIFLGLILAINGALELGQGAWDAWQNGMDWDNLLQMLGGVALLVAGLWVAFGNVGAAIGLLAGGVTLLATSFHDAMENGWNFHNLLGSIGGLLLGGLGIAVLTGSWIPLLIAGISSALLALTVATGHGEELIGGIRQVCEGFVDFIVGIFTGDIDRALTGVAGIFDGLGKAVGAVIDGLRDTLLSFLDWLDEKTGGQFHQTIEKAKGFIVRFFGDAQDFASDAIEAIKLIFSGLVEFIAGVFTNDWDRAWNGLKSIFKGVINGILTIYEAMVNNIISGLNVVIRGIKKFTAFKLPDWMGGYSFNGISIPEIPRARIPRLAAGAVIPPNREFLAVLGDQKSGNNIEAPEDLIRKIVREESGSGTSDYLLREILQAIREGHVIAVDGKILAQVLNKRRSNDARAYGV